MIIRLHFVSFLVRCSIDRFCHGVNFCRLEGQRQMSSVVRKPVFRFPTRSHTNQALQVQKMARGLQFCIWEVEGMCYKCSENKGAE